MFALLENFVNKMGFKKKPDICNRFKVIVMHFEQFDNFIINVCLVSKESKYKSKFLV